MGWWKIIWVKEFWNNDELDNNKLCSENDMFVSLCLRQICTELQY